MIRDLFNFACGLFILLVFIPLVCLWWALVSLAEWLTGQARRFFR